ncbi:hypothetical protein ETD86_16585 [Nonomuraea turkmeniaca]|uniref:Tetratricopeptide repeat protein n=1 Tax=Nonomuraea turkmeniaca TaxID=103838 RepID=A0A5S4FK20_9ACTN|nr:tetratricopeptide repeat protein [Nonomuraea turkmeniaca]TMR21087.1 hypothetical protein ETD86_16585 [Nonomuraea turkmeniaca]
MDTPPHRLGLERAVEVYSGHDDLVGVTGSGYTIGADLVLTSGDVVDPEAPCRVRAAGSARWARAEEVWRGRGGTGVALLRVTEASPWREVPGIDHVRWARVGQGQHRLRCVARGFPRDGDRAARTLSGLVDPPAGAVSKALTAGVLESMPVSLWAGMSGAALLAEPARQIIGVIVTGHDGYDQHRLDVIPVTALLGDERFRELAGVPPGRLETVAEDDPSVILPDLLSPAREDLPADCPDWRLLVPRHAVVPFLGRAEELARLREWADEPGALSIAVLSGRRGTGRTRLAGELCEQLARAGWDAGFLPLDSVCGALSGDADRPVTLDVLRPTLLVVDHPEPSSPLVGELVRRLAKHEHNPPVRILLLVREPGEAEWWRRLDTAAGGWLRRLNTATVQLNARPLTLPERTEHALAAMKAFAPSRAALPAPPPLDDPEFGLPLHVHLAALMRLCDGDARECRHLEERRERSDQSRGGEGGTGRPNRRTERGHERAAYGDRAAERSEAVNTAGGLVARFLAREYEQWAHVWPGERVNGATGRHAVAVVTLTAPTPAELPGLLATVPGLRADAAAQWLGRIFDGGARLGPDVLAERLLAETEDLDRLVLALHDHEGRTARHLVRMLDALRLSVGSPRVRSALRGLVAARIGSMVAEAAAAPGMRLGDAVNAALGVFTGDREIAGAVAGLPVEREVRLGLRALHVTIGELTVWHLRAEGQPIALAGALSVLSERLAAAGRVGEAVVAAAEAVDIFTAAAPYEAAGARAEALDNLGACLLLAGEPGSAFKPVQEAAARFGILAEEEHETRYAGRTARAHYNLACALLGVGRTEEAVEAFAAAGGDPEVAADVAGLLSAAEPLTSYEELVTATPLAPFEGIEDGPPTAALPELAACLTIAATAAVRNVAPTDRDLAQRLHLLAAWLHGHGRTTDALVPAAEAVARLRGLAAEEPGLRFLLATAAGLLSRLHGALDDLDAAARAAAEAGRNLRALVVLDPGEYRSALAAQLLDLGELLLLDDRPDEALDPLQEAMVLAVGQHPQARARWLLGLCLDELGRSADAVAQLEIAAELYDVLSADDDSYRRHLADVRARLGRTRTPPPPGGPRHWMLALVTPRPEEVVARAEQLVAERRESVEGAGEPQPDEIHAYLSAQAMLARAWADAGRAADGFALATQAAELLQRHLGRTLAGQVAALGRMLAGQVAALGRMLAGQVAAALGRTLVGLGRHEEAVPHLRTAIESHGQAGASPASGKELAELLILEAVALSRSGCPQEAEAAADRLVRLYAALVSEGIESPVALAGALRLQGGIRFARQDVEGALRSATRALDVLVPEPSNGNRLVAGACLELSGLCLAELHDEDAAREKLAEGTALLAELGPAPADLADVHLLSLVRLARLRAREEGPAAAIVMYARILEMRPLPEADVLRTLIDDLSAYVTDLPEDADPAALLPPLTAFTEALEREVPLTAGADLHDRHARCLSRLSTAAAQANDQGSAVLAARLAVRVHRGVKAASLGRRAAAGVTSEAPERDHGPATVSGAHRGRLGLALAALARLDQTDLAVAEQAIVLLDDAEHGRELAAALGRYAAELQDRGRPVEALAHCERAADLCDELDDPAVAAAVYAQLGDSLAALDRPHAALEAVGWSMAELERRGAACVTGGAPCECDHRCERCQELPQVRAQAIQVRGRVLRAAGRTQEALAHLVEALQIYNRLPRPPAAAAEVAAMIADDLLAGGRAEEAAEYARTATTGQKPGTVKHALALQRLARCHMMLGELTEANTLVEQLIPLARRSPDDLTYRAILADSLAQSSELLPLLRLDGGTEAEARAREAIAIYDDLMTTGMNAEALHTSRAGASLTLAAALRMRDLSADAVRPLREAVAALERYAPGNPPLSGLLARAMLMLGDALMEAGRPLEAGLVFHRGTQVTRDVLSRAVAHARLGFCQQELGRDDAADAALRVAGGLLRELLADEQDEGLVDLLRDVLRSRLTLLEKAGKNGEARQVEDDLRALRT